MEKGNFRRERLAELGLEQLQRPPDSGVRVLRRRALDFWRRFTAFSGLEKSFYIVAVVLAIAVVFGGLLALVRSGSGNDEKSVSAAVPRSTEKRTGAQPSPTAISIAVPTLPTRIPEPTEEAEPTDQPTQNRRNCDVIRGTPYRSQEERDWFAQNCSPNSGPVGGVPTQPPAPTLPPQPPPPPDEFTASEAIALAVNWISTSAPKAYAVNSGACSAVQIGDHFVVTCQARLAGCQSTACDRTVEVCVFEASLAVVPAKNC
jgi:hypothetical protein